MKCSCANVSQCIWHAGPDILYADGTPVYRKLSADESRVVQLGDLVDEGGVPIARALDPARAVAYATALLDKSCAADSFEWRMKHPDPRTEA